MLTYQEKAFFVVLFQDLSPINNAYYCTLILIQFTSNYNANALDFLRHKTRSKCEEKAVKKP